MKRFVVELAWLAIASCGGKDHLAEPAGSAAPSGAFSSSVATSPSGVTPAKGAYPPLSPKKLVRKASPTDLERADENACAEKNADACRRLADRHRGYGAIAGCGIDRKRAPPFIKRVTDDSESDERLYAKHIKAACDLGDQEACGLASTAPPTYALGTHRARRLALRSNPEELGVWRYREKVNPEAMTRLSKSRAKCLDQSDSDCSSNGILYRTEKRTPTPPKLTPERTAAVIDACKATHDCDEIYMLLDQDGFVPDELAAIRKAMGESLTEGCLAGECTCGNAVRYLAADDPEGLDLAILGCDNGEAEGCYELGLRFEQGRGVDKDAKRARSLYELACPSLMPSEGFDAHMGEFSPRACDRLADIAAAGALPPKNWARAMYYAREACDGPGLAVDHAPCVRLGRFIATSKSTGHNGIDARGVAWGNGDECKRPSVKEICAELDGDLAKVR